MQNNRHWFGRLAVLALLAVLGACTPQATGGNYSGYPPVNGADSSATGSDGIVAEETTSATINDASPPGDTGASTDVFATSDASDAGSPDTTVPAAKSWTVLVYMVADNNLEPYALEDLKEMMQVGSAPGFQILVQVDRSAGYSAAPIGGLGDFTTCKRLKVEKGKLVELADLGEVDRTKTDVLADFIQWGKQVAPADRTMLVFWDHGAGYKGYGVDESVGPGSLASLGDTLSGIQQGLQFSGSDRLDVIGFDACLMATWEVASTFKTVGRYLLASEEVEPGHGWDYRRLKLGRDKPSMDPTAVGKLIADGFLAQGLEEKQADRITLSLVDLDKLPALDDAVQKLANLVGSPAGTLTVALARSLRGTVRYGDSPIPKYAYHMLDLGRTLQLGVASATPAGAQAAAAVSSALNGAVVYKVAGPATQWSTGLSIYLPPHPAVVDESYAAVTAAAPWATALSGFFETAKTLGAKVKLAGVPSATLAGGYIAVAGQMAPESVSAWTDAAALLGVKSADGSTIAFMAAPASVSGAQVTAKLKAQYMGLSTGTGEPTPVYLQVTAYPSPAGERRVIEIPFRGYADNLESDNICVLRTTVDAIGNTVSESMLVFQGNTVIEVPLEKLAGQPWPVVPLLPKYGAGGVQYFEATKVPIDLAGTSLVQAPLPVGAVVVAGVALHGPDGSVHMAWSSTVQGGCGDGLCAKPETTATCALDCSAGPVCGDGKCQLGEAASGCTKDCQATGPVCGDGMCNAPESAASCPIDCKTAWTCGDGACDPDETASTCPSDCAPTAKCGDGSCSAGETPQTCAADCASAAACGDMVCGAGESAQTCSFDCQADNVCLFAKCKAQVQACFDDVGCASLVQCAQDCAGDNACSSGCTVGLSGTALSALSALGTCAGTANCGSGGTGSCGDGQCTAGETAAACPTDCAPPQQCGDLACNGSESKAACNLDCDDQIVCAAAKCPADVNLCLAVADCPELLACLLACNDDQCASSCLAGASKAASDTFQNLVGCMANAKCVAPATTPTCGDGTCDSGETAQSCPADCKVSGGSLSCAGYCGAQAPGGCWCDSACAQNGDCCADKVDVCDSGCKGKCGSANASFEPGTGAVCYCDSGCETYGDCCTDKASWCP